MIQWSKRGARKFSTLREVENIREIVNRMEQTSDGLDEFSYIALFQRCADSKSVTEGRRVYTHYTRHRGAPTQTETIRMKNRYIDMLGKCSCIEEARNEFDQMEVRDAFTWNIMIGGYAQTVHYRFSALELLWRMELQGERPSYITFIALLRACSCNELLHHGIILQARIVAERLDKNVRVATAIQSMYGRCGRVEEARGWFESGIARDLVAWNSMISAYAQSGHLDEVVVLFRSMGLEGVKASKATLVSVLDACTRRQSLYMGRSIHSLVDEVGLTQDVMVATCLVNMYGKCGSLEDAMGVFKSLEYTDIIAWNSLIQACCEHERHEDALSFFAMMDLHGYTPNESTYMSVVNACSTPAALSYGKTIHSILQHESKEHYTDFVKGALVNMYTKGSKLSEARQAFEQQVCKDLISWTSMIVAFAQHGRHAEAMLMFHQLDLEGLKPDRVTFLGALDGCCDLSEGRQLHARVLEQGNITDMQVTALICMYEKCGSFDDAKLVFEDMHFPKGTSAWTAMTAACSRQGMHKEAITMFRRMDLEGLTPNEITYVSVLEACATAPSLKQGRSVHYRVLASGMTSELISNSLVNMYGRCGSLEEAKKAFVEMPRKSVVSWSTLIGAYTHHGHVEDALQLFLLLSLDGLEPDNVIFVSMLSVFSHAGMVAESRDCFLLMAGNYGVSIEKEHYGCILDVLGRAGKLEDAEDLIKNTPYEPSGLQWMSLMCACKTHNDMQRALRVAEHVNGLTPEKATQSCMLLSNMYAACGRFGDAETMRALGLAAQAGHQQLVDFRDILSQLVGLTT